MILQVGVKILIRDEQGRNLFLLRHPSFKPGEAQRWDIPGGRINDGETLLDALKREVSEETGLTLRSVDRLLAAQDIFVSEKDMHVVRLTYQGSANGENIRLSDEHSDYRWMTTDDALDQHTDHYLVEVLEQRDMNGTSES